MLKRKLALNDNQRFLLRNVSIIELGLFINQLLQTVGSIALAHMLKDPVKFGEVNLLLQIFGMVTLFLNVGFNSSLVYTFSTSKEEAVASRLRLAIVGSAFFGVVISVLLAALAPMLAGAYKLPELKGALQLGAIMLIFNSVVNCGLAAFSGNRDFSVQATFMVVMTVFSTLGMLIGAMLPVGGSHILWGVSLWTGIGSIATAVFICWKVERTHRPRWAGPVSLKEMRDMVAYGVPMWAGNIAKAFQQPFLVMMIGSSSVVAVGYLANGLRITGFIGIVTWAFMIVTFPFVAGSSQDLAESKRRGTLCIRYNNLILYPLTLLLCLFPNEINGTLFGSDYTNSESGTYIRLLALGVFFSSVGRLGGNILAGIGKTRANFWVMIVAGIFVVAIVPFISAQSPVLAVAIFTGGWAVSALSMIWFFYREQFPLNWWKAYGEPLVPTLVMGVLMEAGRYTGPLLPLFVALGAAALLLLTLYVESDIRDASAARTFKPNH